MNRFISPLIFTLCYVILCSCSGSGDSGENNIIDVESAIGTGKIHSASDFIKEIKYIPLETTSNSMVGEIYKIKIDRGKIYIRDNNGVINIFDLDGRYLNRLDRAGRGPEEYINIIDFDISQNGHILIISQSGGIAEYDTDLKFVRKLTPENPVDAVGFCDMMILKKGLFASNRLLFSPGSVLDQTWNIYDDSFKTHLSYNADAQAKTSQSGQDQRATIVITPNFYYYYMYDNTPNIYLNGNDTIFNIDIENSYQKSARYVANYGKYRFLPEMQSDPNRSELEAISLGDVFECNRYMFTEFQFRKLAPEPFDERSGKNTKVYGVYDKRNGKLSLLNQPIPQTLGLKNNLNGGAPFWPKSVTKNQELISWYNALDLISLAEEGKIDQSIVANLKEDDNPVVVIAVPK